VQPSVVEPEVVTDLVHERDAHTRAQRVEIGAPLLQVVLVQRDPVGKLPETVDTARGQQMPAVQPGQSRSLSQRIESPTTAKVP
jgi:hypothetical protein